MLSDDAGRHALRRRARSTSSSIRSASPSTAATARRSRTSGSPWSTPPPASRPRSSATTAFPPIRRRSSPARASPTAAATATISRPATIASRWCGRADTGCSSSRSRPIRRRRPRLRPIWRRCGGPTACPSPSSPAPMAARSCWPAPAAVRIDIPLDRPVTPIVLTKTASRAEAEAGDLVQYRLVVRNPDATAATGALIANRSHSGPDAIANRIGSCGWSQGAGSGFRRRSRADASRCPRFRPAGRPS